MKRLLLFFVFIHSYWTFGQLTYSFDVEYYWCGNLSQYCMPNTNYISNSLSGEHFDVFEWTFGTNYGNFRNTTQYPPKIETFTVPIDDEFQLVYHYEYFNELYTLDEKAPPRSITTQYCSSCDYKRFYPADIFNGSIVSDNFLYYYPDRYRDYDLGIMKGRISFQDRIINWHYETVRYRYDGWMTSKTQDYLVINIPKLRKTGSNCYNSGNYNEQKYHFADNIQERDYCIECSVVTGGIAYDGWDDVANGHIELKNFHPNGLVISRTVTNSTNIIAGEQIYLEAKTPNITENQFFPDFVYNWQYSTDGGISWEDVPDKSVTGAQINKKRSTVFTMQEMLGNEHTSVFGPIAFRLGYGNGDRAFTNILHFNYDPGAPVVTAVEYVAPKCSGDPVTSLDVYFDRKLQDGETIWPLQLVNYFKVNEDRIKFQQDEVTSLVYDPIKEKYKYSFIIPPTENRLENNIIYIVQYQAMLNGVPKGTMKDGKSFLYQDPEPLTFSITPKDPLCHDFTGGVTINVKGGSGKYFYSLDEGTKIPFTVTTVETSTTTNNITTISRSASQPLNLSVSDTKINCVNRVIVFKKLEFLNLQDLLIMMDWEGLLLKPKQLKLAEKPVLL